MLEDGVLKLLGGAGSLGLLAYLVVLGGRAFLGYLDKAQAASSEKDKLFAGALDKVTGSIDRLEERIKSSDATMLEIDRSHTTQSHEINMRFVQLVERQGTTIGDVKGQLQHLDTTVGEIKETLQEHGMKIDALGRSLPPPRPIDPPGIAPGGDFRPPRA